MEVGIVGLSSSGKTTTFNALIGGASNAPHKGGGGGGGGMSPTVAMANVIDKRLETIASFITTQKIIPATMRIVDIPGFAAGDGESGKFGKQILAHIREVDALCHVVRCFKGMDGSEPSPAADIDTMDTEMIFADLALAEPAFEKASKATRSGDREAKIRLTALEKCLPVLNEGEAIRTIIDQLNDEELAAIRGYGMLTAKPVLYVANIDENQLGGGDSSALKKVQQSAQERGGQSIAICAQLEAELAELDPDDQREMLESLELEEPALIVMAQALYNLLGLTSFYTAGEKEVRAWPITQGASAPEAAGVIHSDIQRGFIRAECYHIDDLVEFQSEKAIKEAGKLRSEGKNYQMQDGDVVHFLFNV